VRNVFRGGNTYVLIDSNGDGVPDAELRLNGGQFGFMDPQPGSNVLVVDAIFPAFGLTLTGDGLRNTLVGGISQDVITGAGQADTLTGGTGPDRFVYNARTDSASRTYDTITDFNAVADVVDLWFEVTGVDAAITSGAMPTVRPVTSPAATWSSCWGAPPASWVWTSLISSKRACKSRKPRGVPGWHHHPGRYPRWVARGTD